MMIVYCDGVIDTIPGIIVEKVISGMFLTDKRTNLTVEAEMYGLPADTVRRQYTKKRAAAPHPQWDEDYFVFKRVSSLGGVVSLTCDVLSFVDPSAWSGLREASCDRWGSCASLSASASRAPDPKWLQAHHYERQVQ